MDSWDIDGPPALHLGMSQEVTARCGSQTFTTLLL